MSFKITSEFGAVEQIRDNVPHTGIDIKMEVGTKLRSIVNGTIERVLQNDTIGNGVVVRGDNGDLYTYGHLSKITVKVGEHVTPHDIIGLSGNSGHSTGPHLHFAVQHHGHYIDPAPLLSKLERVTGADPFNLYVGEQPLPHTFMDWVNKKADSGIEAELNGVDHVVNPVSNWFQDQLTNLGHWIVANLPDIMGYGAIIAAVCIIFGAAMGKGGMIKPLLLYGIALVIAALVRGGV
jgi:murein DD-endopeptidase MepM/ murein hydrolase activator NlpD